MRAIFIRPETVVQCANVRVPITYFGSNRDDGFILPILIPSNFPRHGRRSQESPCARFAL